MQRDREYLLDILEAAKLALEYIGGKTNYPEGLFSRAGAHSLLRAPFRTGGAIFMIALMALSWLIYNN